MDFEKSIDLPSCGLLRDSVKQLRIGPMTMKAEKVIYTHLFPTQKMVKILSLCSDKSEEELMKFPLADLAYAFVRVRVLSTESPLYRHKVSCSGCEDPFICQANFDDMKVVFLEEIQVQKELQEGDLEPFLVELPKSGKNIRLKYLRAEQHIDLEMMQKQRKSKGMATDERFFVETLVKRTVEVGGNKVTGDADPRATQFYENLHNLDGYAIKDALDAHDFGLRLRSLGSCPHCGEVGEYLVKLDSTFFRPQSGAEVGAA